MVRCDFRNLATNFASNGVHPGQTARSIAIVVEARHLGSRSSADRAGTGLLSVEMNVGKERAPFAVDHSLVGIVS